MKKIILWMMIVLCLSVVRADESTPLVVWSENGDLVVWHDGTSHTFLVGKIIFPILSPSGEQVALIRGTYSYPESLSVISITGDNLRDIDIQYPRQVVWQSETILWVSSYLPPTEGMLSLPLSTILYRIDLETNTMSQWDIEHEFNFFLNPQKTWIAVVLAGIYEQTDTQITIFSTDSSPAEAQVVLRFPTISSASHEGFLPDVQWITETTAHISIRESDAVYATRDDAPLTTVIEFSVFGETKTLGAFPSIFFFSPVTAHDGDSVGYVTRDDNLLIASLDGQTIYHDIELEYAPSFPPMPIPQTSLFAYIQGTPTMMLVGKDTAPTEWFMIGGAFLDVDIQPKGAVIMRLGGIETTLLYVRIGEQEVHEIAKIEYTAFDAKWE